MGMPVQVEADLVVLATGVQPQPDAGEMARKLGISYDGYGFINESHPKLNPVESNTAGIFLAGMTIGPKDIPETRRPGQRCRGQSAGAAQPAHHARRGDDLGGQPDALRRLLHLRGGVPVQRHRAGDAARRAPGRADQRGAVQRLRCLRQRLPGQGDQPARLQRPGAAGADGRAVRRLAGSHRCRTRAEREMTTMSEQHFEPRIVGFLCNWCSYAGANLAGTSRIQYPPNIRIIRVPCSGRVDPLFVVKAFQEGADGVMVLGCHPGRLPLPRRQLLRPPPLQPDARLPGLPGHRPAPPQDRLGIGGRGQAFCPGRERVHGPGARAGAAGIGRVRQTRGRSSAAVTDRLSRQARLIERQILIDRSGPRARFWKTRP